MEDIIEQRLFFFLPPWSLFRRNGTPLVLLCVLLIHYCASPGMNCLKGRVWKEQNTYTFEATAWSQIELASHWGWSWVAVMFYGKHLSPSPPLTLGLIYSTGELGRAFEACPIFTILHTKFQKFGSVEKFCLLCQTVAAFWISPSTSCKPSLFKCYPENARNIVLDFNLNTAYSDWLIRMWNQEDPESQKQAISEW